MKGPSMKNSRLARILVRASKVGVTAALSGALLMGVSGVVGGAEGASGGAPTTAAAGTHQATIDASIAQMSLAGVDPATIRLYQERMFQAGLWQPLIPAMHAPGTMWSGR